MASDDEPKALLALLALAVLLYLAVWLAEADHEPRGESPAAPGRALVEEGAG